MTLKNKLSILSFVLLAGCLFGSTSARAGIVVDTKLSLVIDVSGSVNTTEFNLQMDGYADSFRSSSIQNLILNGAEGQIAVNTVFFSSSATTATSFSLLDSTVAINDFANYLDNVARPQGIGFSTNIDAGINAALPGLLDTTDFESSRLVMDVSGDGTDNVGLPSELTTAVADAEAAGVTINGLAIGDTTLVTYFSDNVITSDGFVQQATDFGTFDAAVDQKLRVELGGGRVPEPGSFAIASMLMLMGVAKRRRRGNSAG